MPPVRRLTAILAADVAGYSRLMGADEEGTHERLREHLRDLIEPKIAEHRGRIVKNAGDSSGEDAARIHLPLHPPAQIAQGPVVCRLTAGGSRIRTCMGLFLSSGYFWFLLRVLCSEVCPGKASMFSRRQSCRGKSQSPVVSRKSGQQFANQIRRQMASRPGRA